MSFHTAQCCCDRRPADNPSAGDALSISSCSVTAVKTSILFVDDEPAMLRVLKMGMRSMADVWDLNFASNGEAALKIIHQKRVDVVVTDMRMPGINGAQLLNQVLRLQPQAIRIILSGYADLTEVLDCIGLTHQFLEKPCSLDELKDCLHRLSQAKSRLANEPICRVAGSLNSLPSLPEIYLEIADALQSPTATAQRIADIATKDPAIATKLLQLSNSAFFGIRHEVYSVAEAVQLLGVSVIQSLAIAVPIFSSYTRGKCPSFPIDQIWEHSLQTGVLAQRIPGPHLDDSYVVEQAFCAGVLHDIGKIILANGLSAEYDAAITEAHNRRVPLLEVEQAHFHATHAEVGAYLLALWGLPIPLVESVANHHHPRHCHTREFCLAGVVHVANALQHVESPHPDTVPSPVDADYLKLVGMERQFEAWRAELAPRLPS